MARDHILNFQKRAVDMKNILEYDVTNWSDMGISHKEMTKNNLGAKRIYYFSYLWKELAGSDVLCNYWNAN